MRRLAVTPVRCPACEYVARLELEPSARYVQCPSCQAVVYVERERSAR